MDIGNDEGKTDTRSVPPLPVLFVENGSEVLRFSEIFGVKEPSRKPTQQRSTNRGTWSFELCEFSFGCIIQELTFFFFATLLITGVVDGIFVSIQVDS